MGKCNLVLLAHFTLLLYFPNKQNNYLSLLHINYSSPNNFSNLLNCNHQKYQISKCNQEQARLQFRILCFLSIKCIIKPGINMYNIKINKQSNYLMFHHQMCLSCKYNKEYWLLHFQSLYPHCKQYNLRFHKYINSIDFGIASNLGFIHHRKIGIYSCKPVFQHPQIQFLYHLYIGCNYLLSLNRLNIKNSSLKIKIN